MAEQNRHCVARQLNIPLYHVGRARLMGIVCSEPAVSDYGYHAAYFTRINLPIKEIVASANKKYGNNTHRRYVKITQKHIHKFTPTTLAHFSNNCIETMAMTMQPILWLAGAIEFGEKWLTKLGHVQRH